MGQTIVGRVAWNILLVAALCLGSLPAHAQKGGETSFSGSDKSAGGIKPQGQDGATQVARLDGVTWEGPGTSIEQLKGKTVMVLTYVTWCPKCNEWAPKLLDDVKQASDGKPVIVMAISTDTPAPKAKEYMERSGFTGPNILHGYDPQIAKNFGFSNEFFNYAIFDPAGELASSGNFGSHMAASQIKRTKDLGKFRFIDPKMPPELQDVLWPMELGYVTGLQKQLKQAEKSLKPADRERLKSTMDRFVEDELAEASELAMGEPSQKIEALEKAAFLANNFKAAKEGKEAKKLVADLTKDKTLKKEISAKKMYDLSMHADDPDRRLVLLEKAAKQFPDTHYGALAEKAAAAAR